ncbi:ComF family protein [Psychromonas sp. CD1]|uniref:ComF family protein n=1 Tax=Psychromonas sp. CD1 TaxID=1979839 RepID=UPI00117A761F|nr:double zinc ribbon domain-containing protein [Psychromonas sp. CD1]
MYISVLYKILNHLSAYFLPAQCLLCRLPSQHELLCQYCRNFLLKQRSYCLHCALPLTQTEAYCAQCMHQKDTFTQIYAINDYKKPYPVLIKNFKYKKNLLNGQLLGQLLCSSIQQNISKKQISQINFLIPIPLHHQRLQQRGFNQAQLLADVIGKELCIPMLTEAVQRIKNTTAQEGLNERERQTNVKNAFKLNTKYQYALKDAYVVIIDDVVSTGSTVKSLCSILLQGGVKRVDIWAICRTARQPQKSK